MKKVRKPRTTKYPDLYITPVSENVSEKCKEVFELSKDAVKWIGVDNTVRENNDINLKRYKGWYKNIKYGWYTNVETRTYKDLEVISFYIGSSIKCIAFKQDKWGSYIGFPAYFKETVKRKPKDLSVVHISTDLSSLGVLLTSNTLETIKEFFVSEAYKELFESAEDIEKVVAEKRNKNIERIKKQRLFNDQLLNDYHQEQEQKQLESRRSNRNREVVTNIPNIPNIPTMPPHPYLTNTLLSTGSGIFVPPLILDVNYMDNISTLQSFQSRITTGSNTVTALLLTAAQEFYIFGNTKHSLSEDDIKKYLIPYLQYIQDKFDLKLVLDFLKEANKNYIKNWRD